MEGSQFIDPDEIIARAMREPARQSVAAARAAGWYQATWRETQRHIDMPFGIKDTTTRALAFMADRPRLMSDLAEAVYEGQYTTARSAIARFREKGFVRAVKVPGRNLWLYEITDAGRVGLAEMREATA